MRNQTSKTKIAQTQVANGANGLTASSPALYMASTVRSRAEHDTVSLLPTTIVTLRVVSSITANVVDHNEH